METDYHTILPMTIVGAGTPDMASADLVFLSSARSTSNINIIKIIIIIIITSKLLGCFNRRVEFVLPYN